MAIAELRGSARATACLLAVAALLVWAAPASARGSLLDSANEPIANTSSDTPTAQLAGPPVVTAKRAEPTAEFLAALGSTASPEDDLAASLDALAAVEDEADPEAARAWMTDPDSSPHGGESLTAFAGRVARWLDEQADRDGSAVAVTHGGVIRGALVHALGAPIKSFWQLDVSPLAVTELHAHDGRWTISRVNCA
jgi:hypothetical protein